MEQQRWRVVPSSSGPSPPYVPELDTCERGVIDSVKRVKSILEDLLEVILGKFGVSVTD